MENVECYIFIYIAMSLRKLQKSKYKFGMVLAVSAHTFQSFSYFHIECMQQELVINQIKFDTFKDVQSYNQNKHLNPDEITCLRLVIKKVDDTGNRSNKSYAIDLSCQSGSQSTTEPIRLLTKGQFGKAKQNTLLQEFKSVVFPTKSNVAVSLEKIKSEECINRWSRH